MSETVNVWERSLKEDEKLLWEGHPTNTQVIDPANKIVIYIELAAAVLWLIFSFIYLIPECDTFAAIIIVELVPIILVLLPLLNARSIKNTVYGITDKRIIIRMGNDEYSMDYDKYTQAEKRSNGTVCVGEAVNKVKPSMERHQLLFHGIQDDNKKCIGVVLYTANEPEKIMEILSSR